MVRLDSVASFAGGTTPPRARAADFFENGTVPWVKTMDLTNGAIVNTDECVTDRAMREVNLSVHPVGTVLVAMYGGLRQIGRTGVLRVPAATNQAITAVLPDPRLLNSDYLLHTLNQNVRHWRSVASSSRRDPNITKDDVKAFRFALPSRDEQVAIAAAIDDAHAFAASVSALIYKREAMRKGLAQALLTGRTRLPSFVDDWLTFKIADVLRPTSERNFNGINLTVLTCTKHHGFVRSLDYFRSRVYSKDLSGYKIIRYGDIGYPANHIDEGSISVQELEDVAVVSPIYVVVEAATDVDTYFLGQLLRLESYREEFVKHMNASVNRRGSLRWPEFSQISVTLPELAEQRAISKVLRDADVELSLLKNKLATARAIERGVADQLLTGKTRLRVLEAVA